jgi:hypothetical protein
MGYKGEKPKGSASKFFHPARLVSAAFPTPSRPLPSASSALRRRPMASAMYEMGAFMAAGDPDRGNLKPSTSSGLRKEISVILP